MNNGLSSLVRSALCVTVMVLALPCFAQGGKDGLTKDFDKLSAKERTKIAAKESKEAAVDTNYQSLMRSAEGAFQTGDYETALARYQEARKMRPYNVYPKVKIQDLQVLLKKQQDKKSIQPKAVGDTTLPEQAAPAVAPEPAPMEHPPVVAPMPTRPATVAAPIITPPLPAPLPVTEKRPAPASPAPAHAPPAPVPVEAPAPKTLGERIFIEGGAVVTERTVMDDDRPTVYRRVVHPSGQVFTFKEGLSIPERMWNERFGE